MPERVQSAAHHHRIHPPFQLFLIPVLITNLIIAIVYLVRIPGLLSGWLVILSSALLLMGFLTRINPIKVQDRLIRLEERLRLAALLPESLRPRIPELTEAQLIGLRFASDAELPTLVERVLAGRAGAGGEAGQESDQEGDSDLASGSLASVNRQGNSLPPPSPRVFLQLF